MLVPDSFIFYKQYTISPMIKASLSHIKFCFSVVLKLKPHRMRHSSDTIKILLLSRHKKHKINILSLKKLDIPLLKACPKICLPDFIIVPRVLITNFSFVEIRFDVLLGRKLTEPQRKIMLFYVLKKFLTLIRSNTWNILSNYQLLNINQPLN